MSDELRDRLRRIDPMAPDVPVEPATTPSSRQRLETIMQTPIIEPEQRTPTSAPADGRPLRRRAAALLGAAAAVAALAVGAVVVLDDGGGGGGGGEVAREPVLDLSLGAGDAMASCLPFDVQILAGMSPAFAATATSVADGTVTLAVDRWYAGDPDPVTDGADTVVLLAQPGMEALIAGFDFEAGQRYLITAAEGTVNFCGYSGPATPELTAAFEEAFAG